jgi:hypothetical protein
MSVNAAASKFVAIHGGTVPVQHLASFFLQLILPLEIFKTKVCTYGLAA